MICGPRPAHSEQKITPAGSRRKVKTWYLCVFLSAELGTRTEAGNNSRSTARVFFSLKVTFLLQCHLSAQPSRRSGSNQLREPSADFSGPFKRSSGIVLRSQIGEKTGGGKKKITDCPHVLPVRRSHDCEIISILLVKCSSFKPAVWLQSLENSALSRKS